MTYVLGFAIAHVVEFFPRGHHLYEVARLRNGLTETLRVSRLHRW